MENKKKNGLLNTIFGFGLNLSEDETNEKDQEQGLELNNFRNSDDEVEITTKETIPVVEEEKTEVPSYEETYKTLLREEEEEKKMEVEAPVKPIKTENKEVRVEKITLGRTEIDDLDISSYQNIVVRVKKFEDSKKIAEYVRNNKIVTLNIEELDKETAQRVMDFLSGAMSVKEASFTEISKTVYVSVPKNQSVLFDGQKRKEGFFRGV